MYREGLPDIILCVGEVISVAQFALYVVFVDADLTRDGVVVGPWLWVACRFGAYSCVRANYEFFR